MAIAVKTHRAGSRTGLPGDRGSGKMQERTSVTALTLARLPRGLLRAAFGVALLGVAAGCAAAGNGQGGYFTKRGRDLQDVFRVGVGYGVGLSAHAQVTDFANVGAGCAFSTKYGLYSKAFQEFSWREKELGFPITNAAGLAAVVVNPMGGPPLTGRIMALPVITISYLRSVADSDMPFFDESSEALAFDSQFSFIIFTAHEDEMALVERFWIEVGATAGVPSASMGFNPVELVDFLLGLTTLDLLGDDSRPGQLDADEEIHIPKPAQRH